jgi:hypothetical protein
VDFGGFNAAFRKAIFPRTARNAWFVQVDNRSIKLAADGVKPLRVIRS